MFEFTIRENDFLNGFLDLLSDYVNKSYKFTMSYLTSPLLSDVRESERLVLLVVNKSVFQNMYSFIKLNDSNMQFASFSCLETAVNSMRLYNVLATNPDYMHEYITGGNFSLDFESGKLTMKKGSIDIGDGNFTVDEEGNLTARRGTFAGTLAAAKGTFSGTLVGVDGNFKGVVQASDFLDRAGNSMMDDERFKSKYLSVYGLAVTNGVRTTFAVDSSGSVTIDGKVTLSAGSTINWASVTNQNLTSNPAYSLASTANANAATAKSAADDAYDEASAAWSRANKAYQDRCTDQNVFDVLTSGGTKFGIFSDSYSGRLYINADYIRSGTINADYIDLSCDYGGFCKGHGSDGQHTTYGAMMYGSNGPGWEPYIIVTNAGARISGSGADLVVSSGIIMSEEPSYGSDLRIKNSIDYDLASYEAFFLALKPSTFKYNKGTSGRKHFGFIAQDVEQAMLDTGLTSDQLAALVKDPVKEILSDGITDYRYSIRYGELIALNTHMIQKLYQMVEELLQQKEG